MRQPVQTIEDPWIFALSAEDIGGTNIIFKSHFIDVIRLHVKYQSISQAITNLNEWDNQYRQVKI